MLYPFGKVCSERQIGRWQAVRLEDYVQIKEAAILLGVAPNTLRNWERNGKLAVYRHPMNGYRLFKRSDLEAILASIPQTRSQHSPAK